MPWTEIDSPLSGSTIPPNVTITGASDAPAGTNVTVTITGTGGVGNTTVTGTVDANGNWSAQAMNLPVGGNPYSITAQADGCSSDSVDNITVQIGPHINIVRINAPAVAAKAVRADVSYTADGTYVPLSPDPLSTKVLVLLHVFRKTKLSQTYSCGYATLTPAQGTWDISLPGPTIDPQHRIVLQALLVDTSNKVQQFASMKKE